MNTLSPQENAAVTEFKAQIGLLPKLRVKSMTLFGSRARGEGHEESDLDILVLVEERTSKIRNQILDIADDIYLKFEIDISPLVLSFAQFQTIKQRERLLASEIEHDGLLL